MTRLPTDSDIRRTLDPLRDVSPTPAQVHRVLAAAEASRSHRSVSDGGLTHITTTTPRRTLVAAVGLVAAVTAAVVLLGTPGGERTPDARAAVVRAIAQLPSTPRSGELRIDSRTVRDSDQAVVAASSSISRYNGADSELIDTDELHSIPTMHMVMVKGALYRRFPGQPWEHMLPPPPFTEAEVEAETAKTGPGLDLRLATSRSLTAITGALTGLVRTDRDEDISTYSGTTTAEALEVAKEQANTDIPVPIADKNPTLSRRMVVQIVVNTDTDTIRSLTFIRRNEKTAQTSRVTIDFKNLDTPQTIITAPTSSETITPPNTLTARRSSSNTGGHR